DKKYNGISKENTDTNEYKSGYIDKKYNGEHLTVDKFKISTISDKNTIFVDVVCSNEISINDFTFNLLYIDGNKNFVMFNKFYSAENIIDQIVNKYGYLMPLAYRCYREFECFGGTDYREFECFGGTDYTSYYKLLKKR